MHTVSAIEAKTLLEADKAILIDVRDPDEFAQAHIAYAQSVPLKTLFDELDELKLAQDKTVIFQCQKGMRGLQACDIAAEHEVDVEVVNLDGGIEAWQQSGLPLIIEGEQKTVMPLMQQVQIVFGVLIFAFVALGYSGIDIAYALAGMVGVAMVTSALTGWCGLAVVLNKMPWNH